MIPKFRAWDKEELCWINIATLNFDGEFWYLAPAMDDFNPIYYESELGETWELMQSTGLKDKNGVEIFEGDIVEVEVNDGFDYGSFIGVVEFLEGAWMVNNRINHARSLWSETNESEILGNIHENPELLS